MFDLGSSTASAIALIVSPARPKSVMMRNQSLVSDTDRNRGNHGNEERYCGPAQSAEDRPWVEITNRCTGKDEQRLGYV